MLCIEEGKIDAFFAEVAKTQDIYIPHDDESCCNCADKKSHGANFTKWAAGVKLSSALKTVRSGKDFFFPKAENLVNYKVNGATIEVVDPRADVKDFAIFGVRACDAKSFSIIDAVYLKMDPVDTYYKNRRDHGTIITLACNNPERTCFCGTYGIDAADGEGDISAYLADGKFYFNPKTDKGRKLLDAAKGVLVDGDASVVDKCKGEIKSKIEKLPFSHLDLSKVGALTSDEMMAVFNNNKVWDSASESCLGCGTCTYICPTCMCFDVRDFDSGKGVRQVRCWDSCMFSDFTQMAAANPRLTQKERSRQRFMHKLVYYPMAHDGVFSCVGCGRCLESCPINMNIVKVIKALGEGGQ